MKHFLQVLLILVGCLVVVSAVLTALGHVYRAYKSPAHAAELKKLFQTKISLTRKEIIDNKESIKSLLIGRTFIGYIGRFVTALFILISLVGILVQGKPELIYLPLTPAVLWFVIWKLKQPKPLPPPIVLPPGQSFRATISPAAIKGTRHPNCITLLIELTAESRRIIDQHNLAERWIFEASNPEYEVWMHHPDLFDEEPDKKIPVTIGQMCHPKGFVRCFPTPGEAKAWAGELRDHIETLKLLLLTNAEPPKKETFDL